MDYIVVNRIFVTQAYTEQFEERFRKRAGQIDKQPGFINLKILKPQEKEGAYMVMTTWKDEEAFMAWVKSEDFKQAHQNTLPKEAFREGGGIERYEVIIQS